MPFQSYIHTTRPALETHLLSFLKEKASLPTSLPFYKDLLTRLSEFTPKGKMLRGLFVLLMAEMYGDGKIHRDQVLPVAGAMEIVQSAFLIHDDIMDNDRMRRGHPTIFAQYEDQARNNQITDTRHYGHSMGICVGDVAFFLAFDLIQKVHRTKSAPQIIETFLHEIEIVSAAQMTDMHYGLSQDEPTLREIRTMYLHKTARYSFSLPFMLGALFAQAPEEDIDQLRLLGEYIGIAFQIKDDEIKLMGSADEVGTDIGSDIRENKKTLIRAWLFERAGKTDRQKLHQIFGNNDITEKDIAFVQTCLHTYDIPAHIEQEIHRLTKRAYKIIDGLKLSSEGKSMLREVVEYVVSRKK